MMSKQESKFQSYIDWAMRAIIIGMAGFIFLKVDRNGESSATLTTLMQSISKQINSINTQMKTLMPANLAMQVHNDLDRRILRVESMSNSGEVNKLSARYELIERELDRMQRAIEVIQVNEGLKQKEQKK